MKSLFLLAGPLATIIYVFTVIYGAAIRPGYSHVYNFISELISAKAPNKEKLNPLFLAFNILTGVFAVGFLLSSAGGSLTGRWAALVLIVEAIAGFATVFFPQDERTDPVTPTGTMHIVLAGLSSLTTMGAMLLAGLWFNSIPAIYTFISLAVVFITGGMTAVATGRKSPVAGLLERITIGGFLQWMLVVGLLLSIAL
jgi:hypothetical membrane protein